VWTDLFVAAAGASAALAGLVFVALSVNKSQLIRASHLPPGAAATIGTLILILFSSVAALIHHPSPALGIEIIAFGLYACWLELSSARQGIAARAKFQRPQWESVLNAVRGQIEVLPFIVWGNLAAHKSRWRPLLGVRRMHRGFYPLGAKRVGAPD
jgi:hypothetical protein